MAAEAGFSESFCEAGRARVEADVGDGLRDRANDPLGRGRAARRFLERLGVARRDALEVVSLARLGARRLAHPSA